jgi:hypothetical protein
VSMPGDSGDVSAEVHIEVDGTDQLRDAGQVARETGDAVKGIGTSAEEASGPVEELGEELDELGDSGPGIEETAAGIGHIRDNAAEADGTVGALGAELDALAAKGTGLTNFFQVLKDVRDEMADMDRGEELTIYRGGSGGWGIVPPAGEVEDEFGNVETVVSQSKAKLAAQLEELERELGTFETSAMRYLHTVGDLQTGMSNAMSLGNEATVASGSTVEDLTGKLADLRQANLELINSLMAGEAILGMTTGEMDSQSAAAYLDADSMAVLATNIAAAQSAAAGMEGTELSLGDAFEALSGMYGASAAASALARGAEDAEMDVSDLIDTLGNSGGGGGGGLSGALKDASGAFSDLGESMGDLPSIPSWLTTTAKWAAIGALIAGSVSVLTPFAAGLVSFGAEAVPELIRVYEAWDKIYDAEKAVKSATTDAARDSAAKKLAKDWASLPPEMREVVRSIDSVWTAMKASSRDSGISKDVLEDIPRAASVIKESLPAFASLGKAFAPQFGGWLTELEHWEGSPGFKSFISDLDKDMPGAASSVRQVGDVIGGIINSLTKPGAVKDAESMFTGIAGGLRAITPAAVNELAQVEKILGGIGRIVSTGTKPGGMLQELGRGWDDLWQGASNAYKWGQTGVKAVGDFGDYVAGALTTSNSKQQSSLWDALFSNLGSGATAAATTAGHKAGQDYNNALRDALGSEPKNAPLAGTTSLSSGLQKSLDTATRQVKIHGVTVDLSDAKLSGLSAMQSTLAKAAQQAGRDYDTSLADAIASLSTDDVAKARALLEDIQHAMSGMRGVGTQAGTALGDGLAAGIQASTPAAVGAATALADAVTAAVRAAHQTASPSKVFWQIGKDDIAGLILGLEDGKLKLADVIKALDPTTALKKLIETAESYGKSIASAAEQGADLSTLYGETQAGQMASGAVAPSYPNMAGAMKAQLAQIRAFNRDIKRLQHEGLSKALIEQLLSDGPATGLPVAQSMLAGGKAYIHEIDKLQGEINRASQQLGATGANIRYGKEVGEDVAKGLAPGIHSIVAAIKSQSQKVQLGDLHADITINVDGKRIANVTQKYTLQRAGRNTSSGLKLPNRGA